MKAVNGGLLQLIKEETETIATIDLFGKFGGKKKGERKIWGRSGGR